MSEAAHSEHQMPVTYFSGADSGPTIDELRAFLAVAEAGSFAAAAVLLGRDASILTRRVRALEHHLGIRLFSRTTRAVALTEAGALYRQRTQTILDELESANREASDLATSPRGLLRVSVPLAFGRRWIAPMLPDFSRDFPDITLDVRFTDRFVDLVSEGFDLAIRVGQLPDSSYTAKAVATYQTILVAAPDYVSRQGRPATPEDLSAHVCLGFTSHVSWPNWNLKQGDATYTVRPRGPVVSDSSDALVIVACAGHGIMLAPTWLISDQLRDGSLVRVLPKWRGANDGVINALLPPGRIIPTKTRVFAERTDAHLKNRW